MPSFHRVDTSKLLRGAARIMYANALQVKPVRLSHVMDLTTFEPKPGWNELGATSDGIQIAINNDEESPEIDQGTGEIGTAPSVWECSVATRLAEITLEHFVIVWEGSEIETDASSVPPERVTGLAGATSYTERRLAVMFQKPNGKVQGFLFHRAVRSPEEGTLDFRKSGEAMTVSVRFNILADPSETDPKKRFFVVREQT
jgi:hypothetical protein